MNEGIGSQGQEINVHVDDFLGFLDHLAFGNPQGRLGHGYGKVVDFDAVELTDGDFDGVYEVSQYHLAFIVAGNSFILQFPQRQVGFRQEVSAAAGRIGCLTTFDTITRLFP